MERDNSIYLSYWEKSTYFSDIDIAIIGSGIVGLNAALSLKHKNPKLKILVLERGMLPYGASTRNAGFACFGSVSEILDDLKTHSEDEVLQIIEKRWLGLQRLRRNVGDKAISYESTGGYELFSNHDLSLFQECESKINYLNHLLEPITGTYNIYKTAHHKAEFFGFNKITHVIKNKAEGLIDTGKMMHALLKKAQSLDVIILNNITIHNYDENENGVEIHTANKIIIKAKKLLLATNGFTKEINANIDVHPARAQVLITSPIKGLNLKGGFHYDKGYYYFRNIGEKILLGGGRNLDFEAEETTEMTVSKKIQDKLESMLSEIIIPGKNFKIEMRWSGIMGVGPKKKPIISQLTNHTFCAVRMGGMGVAIGSLVGEEAADMILNNL